MQLSYRGAAYKLSQPALSVTASDTYATFLGRRYRVRQVQPLPRSLPTPALTYRGVKYNSPLST